MIKVLLKNGNIIEVLGGKVAKFQPATQKQQGSTEIMCESTLDVRDETGRSGKVVASFITAECAGFVADS